MWFSISRPEPDLSSNLQNIFTTERADSALSFFLQIIQSLSVTIVRATSGIQVTFSGYKHFPYVNLKINPGLTIFDSGLSLC